MDRPAPGAGWSRPLLGGLLALLLGSGPVAAGSAIVPDAPAVASLADGRSGVIAFESITPRRTRDYIDRTAPQKVVVAGALALPDAAAGPVPAVVILHGSSGVNPGEWVWAKRMNALGFASFVVDSFTGRGIAQTETDQTQLSMMADIADAFAALRLLASHPAIDARRIAVMGFSRGGVAALYSVQEPFRRAVLDDGLRFAAHVAFYPGCSVSYDSAHLDGAPVLMLLGGRDNYTPAAPCLAYADTLRAHGAAVSLAVYPDAFHGFDRPTTPHPVPRATSARNCHGRYDLDGNTFAMTRDGQTLRGADAAAEARRCLSLGVTLGGDPLAREKAPADVAAFLKSAFGMRP